MSPEQNCHGTECERTTINNLSKAFIAFKGIRIFKTHVPKRKEKERNGDTLSALTQHRELHLLKNKKEQNVGVRIKFVYYTYKQC